MELTDKVTVVTGGASGIGEALARRFAEQGAAAVTVADMDGPGAQEVASQIAASHPATATASAELDVTNEAAIGKLVADTVAAHGRLDVFVSNAGYVTQGGLEVGNEEIQRMWEVHVMSHVYAARACVPHMAAAGGGYLLNTASAAGLLTQIGSLQYSITKAAAVSLGEWLAITYGERGVVTSMLCPQAVETNILANSPDNLASANEGMPDRGTPGAAAGDGVLSPQQLADVTIDAMREERFLVLPHPEVQTYRERKASDVDRWLDGMRRFQAKLYSEADSTPADWFLA